MTPAVAGGIAFAVGFSVMSVELASVRIMAPFFGDGTFVWTNVIGVLLGALAAGAWLGGILAGTPRNLGRVLAGILVTSGLGIALSPVVVKAAASWLVPPGAIHSDALAAIVSGSLVCTLGLFAPPLMLLGAVTPILVALRVEQGEAAGPASGSIAAASTVGSLLGTFATTHYLVPEIGSRGTLWGCATVLLVAGSVAARSRRALPVTLLPLGLALLPLGPLREPAQGRTLVAEVESSLQYLMVEEVRSPGAPVETRLAINEGWDISQSFSLEGDPFPEGYPIYHLATVLLAGDGRIPRELRAVCLGAAAGTVGRMFEAAFPAGAMDGVEVDPEVVRLGARYFGGNPVRGSLFAGVDARVFANNASRGIYHLVLLDTFSHNVQLPAHVMSRESFEGLHRTLAPGGILTVNFLARGLEDPVLRTLAATMAAVFGEAHAFRVPFSTNFLLLARAGAPFDPGGAADAEGVHPKIAEALGRLGDPGAWRTFGPEDAVVLEDDRPFLDRLVEARAARVLGDLAGRGRVEIRGDRDPGEVATEASRLVHLGRARDALETIARARGETGPLRRFAGQARLLLGDPAGALLELRRARELGIEPFLEAWLEETIGHAEDLARKRARARGVADRNDAVALLVAFLLPAYAGGVLAFSRRTREGTGAGAGGSGEGASPQFRTKSSVPRST